jgi:hypothetical protein
VVLTCHFIHADMRHDENLAGDGVCVLKRAMLTADATDETGVVGRIVNPSYKGHSMNARCLILLLTVCLPSLAHGSDLTGEWSGHWRDTKSGHSGPLRASFTRCGDDAYRVTFTGRFFKVIPFRYSVQLDVTAADGERVYLTGEQRIPIFGTFHYWAVADCTDFVADFCSRRYQGQFVLRRQCR